MRGFSKTLLLTSAMMAMGLTAPSHAADEPTREAIMQAAKEWQIEAIPAEAKVDADKAALGNKLYHDPILSVDGTISCATCHALEKGGTDQLPVSVGVKGQKGPINSPTVFNSAHNFVQFWDGRAKDLEAQALGPVENPKEMGEQWPNAEKKVAANAEYKASFDKLYEGKVTKETIASAIAEFERTLITPGAKFDRYLQGDDMALNASEKRGFITFVEKGCVSCHSGTYFGGNSYQMLNPEYFTARGGEITDADLGRFNVTKDEGDKHSFKVPLLRNVAVTAPYFHDASAKNLKQAVRTMAKFQLGETLTDAEATDIENFLKSLTGTYNGKPL